MLKLKSHKTSSTAPKKDSLTHSIHTRVLPSAIPELVNMNKEISEMENTPKAFCHVQSPTCASKS